MLKSKVLRILLAAVLAVAVWTAVLSFLFPRGGEVLASEISSGGRPGGNCGNGRPGGYGNYSRAESSAEETVTDSEVQVHVGDYIETVSAGSVTLVAAREEKQIFDLGVAHFDTLLVGEGDYVEEGQPIFTYTVEYSEASLEQARRELERTREAYETGIASREEEIAKAKEDRRKTLNKYDDQIALYRIEQLELALAEFKSRQEQTIADLEEKFNEMEEQYAGTTFCAGMAGFIQLEGLQYLKKGDRIEQKSLTIADPTSYLLAFSSPRDFRYGMKVEIEYGLRNQRVTLEGVIIASDDLLEAYDLKLSTAVNYKSSDIFLIKVSGVNMAEDYDTVRVMVNATARGESKHLKDVLLIGRKAVTLENGANYVMLYENGAVRKQMIQTGNGISQVIWVVNGLQTDSVIHTK